MARAKKARKYKYGKSFGSGQNETEKFLKMLGSTRRKASIRRFSKKMS